MRSISVTMSGMARILTPARAGVSLAPPPLTAVAFYGSRDTSHRSARPIPTVIAASTSFRR
jgi:hypothetical protein